MGTLFIYLLKVSLLQALFFLFNKSLLSRETMHRFNRLWWLLTTTLAFSLPFAEVPNSMFESNSETFFIPVITQTEELPTLAQPVDEPTTSYWYWIVLVALTIWAIGVIVLIVRRTYAYYNMARLLCDRRLRETQQYAPLISSAKAKANCQDMPITLIVPQSNISPFSWFRCIAISKDDIDSEGETVLIHELIHAKQGHSWDMLLMDFVAVAVWFNPATWLAKQELQLVHEYLADEAVIQSGINEKSYQYLLIKKAAGEHFHIIANSFNHSNLKKRITMMCKKKSSQWARAKSLYALPLACIAVVSFASESIAPTMEQIEEVKVMKDQSQNLDPMQNSQKQPEASVANLFAEIATPESTHESESTDEGDSKSQSDTKRKPLVVIDGVISDKSVDELGTPPPASITVLKGDAAVDLYGEKAKDGAIIIKTKDSTEDAPRIKVFGTKEGDDGSDIKVIGVRGKPNIADITTSVNLKGKPLYIIDGRESKTEASDIDALDIASISVLKDSAAVASYGDKAKNGVVIITTKDAVAKDVELMVIGEQKDKAVSNLDDRDLLIIVDGEVYEGSVNDIDSKTIATINVLKSEAAIERYGQAAKGKKGVLEITLKKNEDAK